MPSTNDHSDSIGVPQPGVIIANGYLYAFYPYFPTVGYPDAGPSTIQLARAPLSGDGAPGTWTKYYNGTFDAQPGLSGLGSQVIPSTSACTRPAQPWPAYSTYLNEYVLTFLCKEGWFFSTSPDLLNWSTPVQFFTAPAAEFSQGQETDENVILVTPGNAPNVIGQTGYVLYASTLRWGQDAHELWLRPFTFGAGGQPSPQPGPQPSPSPNPPNHNPGCGDRSARPNCVYRRSGRAQSQPE